LTAELYKTYNQFFSNYSKQVKERTFPNSFTEASTALIPKPGKDTTNKENHKVVYLIKTDTKTLNKI
jgi:hypothetical protein